MEAPRDGWAVVDHPELSTKETLLKLGGESDALWRMECLIRNYFTDNKAELIYHATQKLTGAIEARLDHMIARDLAKVVVAELVEHESQWRKEIRGARRKVSKEADARERIRERTREENRQAARAGW